MNKRLSQINQHFDASKPEPSRPPVWTLRTFEPYDFHRTESKSLKGMTVFITGASRGIGLEIAKRCAQDGANIAIVAKTASPNPNLPGTIYTAQKEIEAAGGKCLAMQCDIRNADNVAKCIEKTVETFGGLDILVNNASALKMGPVEHMKIKDFDLVSQIKTRGTFAACKFAIPHLRKSKNPHILTIAPPMYMAQMRWNWFASTGTGYTLGKYSMTLITHGLAGELRDDGIACNTLWPRTAVQTAAVQNLLGGDESMATSRLPSIMSDAAHVILTSKSKLTTDNFFMDDEVLISEGATITDLQRYMPSKNLPQHKLMADFLC